MSERFEYHSEEELMSASETVEQTVSEIMKAIKSGENFVLQIDPRMPPELTAELMNLLEKAGVNPTVMEAE